MDRMVFSEYLLEHSPEDKMLYNKDAFWKEAMLMRDFILPNFGNKVEVIGTHFSKSIEHPVILTETENYSIVWQCNLYYWQIMVEAKKPVIFPKTVKDICNVGKEDNIYYLFYQGIPIKYQYKAYNEKDNNMKFGISVSNLDTRIMPFISFLKLLLEEN